MEQPEQASGVSEIRTSSGVDLDVEGVIEKQDTHDLICPNCNSFITKKVVLRRKATTDQPEDDLHPAVSKKPEDDRVFTCLSCLSFFRSAGNGILEIFGAKDKEPTPDEPGTTVSMPEIPIYIPKAETEEPGWEILKSIVYGGLLESITSLGVVSSAAGAGAATLNIMVLGLANLIGGLFAIAHSLRELRNDPSRGGTNETEDRYCALLGRREQFKMHVVLVILSYLIFGALPPVIYGFSFRESDDKDLKVAVVAASSLVCITLLAIGKVRVEKPPKSYFKTVLYYITLGFMASSVSYVVGDLFEKLLTDLGLFETSSAVTNAHFHDHEQGWASY